MMAAKLSRGVRAIKTSAARRPGSSCPTCFHTGTETPSWSSEQTEGRRLNEAQSRALNSESINPGRKRSSPLHTLQRRNQRICERMCPNSQHTQAAARCTCSVPSSSRWPRSQRPRPGQCCGFVPIRPGGCCGVSVGNKPMAYTHLTISFPLGGGSQQVSEVPGQCGVEGPSCQGL